MTEGSEKRKTKNAKQSFTSHKLDWINDVVSDPDQLTHFQSRVAVGLSIYFNEDTGEGYVRQNTLAKRVGGTRRATQLALDRLVETGYLRPPKIGAGSNGANIYTMVKREERLSGCESTSSTFERADSHPANPDSHPPRIQIRTPCESPFAQEHLCLNTSASTPMQDIYSPPSVSDGEAKKESAREDGEIPTTATTTSLLEAKIVTTSTAVEILPPDSGFEAFWAAYPNKVGKAGARRKFHEILTKGQATASEMIEGAKYYREYQAVKDPNRQYTKHPETWLNKGCWPDRPPIPDGPHAHSNRRLTTAEQVQVGLMNNLRRRGLA